MIIVMKPGATPRQIDAVATRIEQRGCKINRSTGEEHTVLGVIGDVRNLNLEQIERLDGVDRLVRIQRPFKLASRDFHPFDTVIEVEGVAIGGKEFIIMGGPCAVESEKQLMETAYAVKEAGGKILRGGAYKPRTSPYSFQGLGEEGLRILVKAREETGLPIVTEVMEAGMVQLVASYADILQIGARNMQNFALLHAVGEIKKPILLKRGIMSTIEELLMAAEHILSAGNDQVILCERGIRTFETYTRNTLDISAIPLLKQLSHLPVIVDPSHATGKWDLIDSASRASLAAGADGLIIEVHPNPEEATSDGAQSLKPDRFKALIQGLKPIALAVGKTI